MPEDAVAVLQGEIERLFASPRASVRFSIDPEIGRVITVVVEQGEPRL